MVGGHGAYEREEWTVAAHLDEGAAKEHARKAQERNRQLVAERRALPEAQTDEELDLQLRWSRDHPNEFDPAREWSGEDDYAVVTVPLRTEFPGE